ncbi:MAG: hypothetical protein L6290_07905 [Thermodesulfovibrionales bacterium]|nr:hypothetical protein [Thermodesulfovibrionales bacterium]
MEHKHSETIHSNVHELETTRLNELKKESTVALVRRIVEDSDKLSLKVFLETRKLFCTRSKKPLLLDEFLLVLHEKMAKNDFKYQIPNVTTTEVADCVYDKTKNKYMNMPQRDSLAGCADDRPSSKKEVDCRKCYSAFLIKMQRKIDEGEIKTQEDEEVQSGILLRNLVAKNFFSYSFMDCRRDLSHSIRYEWKVGGGTLSLWHPPHVKAAEFREWLKTRITDVDLKRPNENQRIQSLIDEHFGSIFFVSIDQDPGVVFPGSYEIDPLEAKQKQMFPHSLAEAVAGEKVANIHELRPAIRAMGKEALKRLILDIFSDLAEQGDYELNQLAREYEISKSTLSRFAGTKWKEDKDSNVKYVPDLWQNTAEILGKDPVFMETAFALGFADRIKEVLESIKP